MSVNGKLVFTGLDARHDNLVWAQISALTTAMGAKTFIQADSVKGHPGTTRDTGDWFLTALQMPAANGKGYVQVRMEHRTHLSWFDFRRADKDGAWKIEIHLGGNPFSSRGLTAPLLSNVLRHLMMPDA